MATATLSLKSNIGNQTDWTNVIGVIAGYFATFGWVQTSDTGQINMSTQQSGYQIWGLGDSLQGTSPFYMKITYGLDFHPYIQMSVQFGTGTNGSGTLTGQVSQSATLNMAGATSSPQKCFLSGDTNRITWNLFDGPTEFEGLNLGVERTKDSSGNDTGSGLIIFTRANGGGSLIQGAQYVFSQVLPSTGTVGDAQPLWPAAINLAQSTMASTAFVGWAYPIPFNGAPFNCGKNFLLYQGTDFPAYTVQALTVYGTSHNYLVCTPNAYPPTQPPALSHVLMRFE